MARRAISLIALISLSAGLSCALGRDPALTEARLDEQAGDRGEAARMYAGWLKENSGSPEAPVIFLHYASLESNLTSLIEQGETLLQASNKGIKSSAATALIARVLEVAGRAEEARDAYLAAFRNGESSRALEAAFLLSLEMNDVNALLSALDAFKDTGGEQVDFLRACLSFQKGDDAPADAVLLRIAGSTTDEEIALRALWLSYEISRRAADSSAALEAIKRLRARFPHSPEYLMAQAFRSAPALGSNVVPLELPGKFFTAGEESSAASDDSSTPGPVAKTAPPATLSVQVGSFQMKENAEDLAGELTRKGFSPSLHIDTSQGRQLYRVTAGSGLGPEDARALLDRLRAAGLGGFLLKDQ